MRKITRKAIALVAAVILLFGLCIPAYAAESEIQPCIDFVATMKIVSFTGSGGIVSSVGLNGHSFLIFTNSNFAPNFHAKS